MRIHTDGITIQQVKEHQRKHLRWTWVEWTDEFARTGNLLDWCVAMSLMEGDIHGSE